MVLMSGGRMHKCEAGSMQKGLSIPVVSFFKGEGLRDCGVNVVQHREGAAINPTRLTT